MTTAADVRIHLDGLYRNESRRALATLIRLLGDFDVAEDALQEAFAAAAEKWPQQGIPDNALAWLVSTGRFKAIDRLRRESRFDRATQEVVEQYESDSPVIEEWDDSEMPDDRLRLIFTCCHPTLSRDAQIALTLREVCGLTTEQIASAFLIPPPTLAQRIVRAKRKIKQDNVPYEVPSRAELPRRLDSVLQVVYLVFNEGYSASSGDALTRPDLSDEAIHLARMLAELLPEPEVFGLLALMLLHESRRPARTTGDGDVILLEEQDRSLWDMRLIHEGLEFAERAWDTETVGEYAIQAAISAVHAESPSAAETNWNQIVGLYDLLSVAVPSPVVELNRAVAIAMRDGPAVGLRVVEEILARGELDDYHRAYAAKAELHRRLGQKAEALAAYDRAIALAPTDPEKRFLDSIRRKLET